jgi:methionine sulfoxide reductase heme-binding subunit
VPPAQHLDQRDLKISVWLLAAWPLANLIYLTLSQQLGTNPQETLLRATGTWCLTLLLVTLGVSTARRWLNWPELLQLRRMLGLWAFAYAVIHLFGFYAFEHDFQLRPLLKDSLQRPFVTVGLLALIGLVPLAATSTRAAQRRLGRRWKKIHKMIYLIALLACVHFFLHRAGKNNFADPLWALGITLGLLGERLFRVWNPFRRN